MIALRAGTAIVCQPTQRHGIPDEAYDSSLDNTRRSCLYHIPTTDSNCSYQIPGWIALRARFDGVRYLVIALHRAIVNYK